MILHPWARLHQQASADDVGGLGVESSPVGELDVALAAPADDVHHEQLRGTVVGSPCEDVCRLQVALIRYACVGAEVGIG